MSLSYSNYFSRGYIITDNQEISKSEHFASWNHRMYGQFLFMWESKTEISDYSSKKDNESCHYVFIGYPTDIENTMLSPSEIAKKASFIHNTLGIEAYEKYIAYLGGRFLSVLIELDHDLIVYPDCHATYACYYINNNSEVVLSSHLNILQNTLDLEIDEEAVAIVNSDKYHSPGGRYYPALMTAYLGVKPLFSNCCINYNTHIGTVNHTRFYPFKNSNEIVKNTKSPVDFKKYFEQHVASIVKDKNFLVSLTSGLDSKATFFAILKNHHVNNCNTFTYFNGSRSSDNQIKDLTVASSLSFKYGIPHKTIYIKKIDYSSSFHKFYTHTFRRCARYPSLARAYYEELPHNKLSLVSTCSETGMAFYKKRDETEITPSLLSKLFTPSSINKDPKLVASFSKYIEHTDFFNGRLSWLDFYDAFYWEHRNAKWASLWYSESDLAHFTVVPFNQRDIIESMLAAPLEDRFNKKLIKDYISSFNH